MMARMNTCLASGTHVMMGLCRAGRIRQGKGSSVLDEKSLDVGRRPI